MRAAVQNFVTHYHSEPPCIWSTESALLVRPAQPFLELLHRVDATSAQLTLEDLAREPTICLLPEWVTEEEALEHLATVSSEVFDEHFEWKV